MAVIYEPWAESGEITEFFKDMKDMYEGTYLDGECFAFAIALHRGLNWRMIALIVNGEIRHAVLLNPKDNCFFDARGLVNKEEFGLPFGVKPPYELRAVSEKELYDVRTIRDMSISRARQMAENLWPELPWKNSMKSRVSAFAEDLEKISREHGLWIRAMVPAVPPLLSEGYGDEGGYTVRPVGDGSVYSINRHLNET